MWAKTDDTKVAIAVNTLLQEEHNDGHHRQVIKQRQ